MSNPLLEKIKLPGKIFQLPSKGIFYNDELKNINGEIHVQPMNTFDEIILKNPDMLFSGRAMEPVFANCIKDINKPNDLLGKDIDAIMLFLRLVTYGPIYEISASHNCENAKYHIYNINLEEMVQNMKYIDPAEMRDIFVIELENGQVVNLRPARYIDTIQLMQENQNKKELTVDDIKKNVELNMLSIIKDIDGISDRELILEWIQQAPANLIEKIITKVSSIHDWGLDLTVDLQCRDCGESFKIELPINPISFF